LSKHGAWKNAFEASSVNVTMPGLLIAFRGIKREVTELLAAAKMSFLGSPRRNSLLTNRARASTSPFESVLFCTSQRVEMCL